MSRMPRWIVTTLGVLAAATIVDGIEAESMVWLLGASLLLGILNAILRPFLMVLALPLSTAAQGLRKEIRAALAS